MPKITEQRDRELGSTTGSHHLYRKGATGLRMEDLGTTTVTRRADTIGTGVMSGMLAATFLAIFFVPLFYVLICKRARRRAHPVTTLADLEPPRLPEEKS